MIKLDVDKVQVRYITGINKCLPGYPTPLDVLYESCKESADTNLFSDAKMENNTEAIKSSINRYMLHHRRAQSNAKLLESLLDE